MNRGVAMPRRTSAIIVGVFLLAGPAAAQTIAEQKAQVDLEKARLDEIATARAALVGSNATSTLNTPDKTAEVSALRDAAYGAAAAVLAARFEESVPQANRSNARPLLVYGSAPPSVTLWLKFREDKIAAEDAIKKAKGEWDKVTEKRPGDLRAPLILPALLPALGAVGTVLSLLRTDSVISGTSIKAEDGYLSALLLPTLKTAFPNLDDSTGYRIGSDGGDDAHELLGKPFEDDCTLVRKLADTPFKPPEKPTDADKAKTLALKSLGSAADGCEKLKATLLTDLNGLALATVIKEQRSIALGDYATRPLFYVVAQDAALTTITKKNLLTGLRSTPATLTARLRISYLILTGKQGEPRIPVAKRGNVVCEAVRVKFDAMIADKKALTVVCS